MDSPDSMDSLILSRHQFKDIGPQASWTVSSAKPGFDIALVQDASLESYWQSDGPQPHYINIHFDRLVGFTYLSIYLNFQLDESYTPNAIRILSGMGYHTLLEIQSIEFLEPVGWHHIDLTQLLSQTDCLFETRLIQIQVLTNHQNGKDTHIRAIRIHSPLEDSMKEDETQDLQWKRKDFDMMRLVR